MIRQILEHYRAQQEMSRETAEAVRNAQEAMQKVAPLSFLVVPVWPWGQINIKRIRDSLFSERNGAVPTVVFLGLRFTWRRWRKI